MSNSFQILTIKSHLTIRMCATIAVVALIKHASAQICESQAVVSDPNGTHKVHMSLQGSKVVLTALR